MLSKNSQLFLLMAAVLAFANYAVASSKPKEPAEGEKKTSEETIADSKKQYELTDNYVHSWLNFPTISATSIFRDEDVVFKPKQGYITAVVFLASWCLPCQKIFPKLHQLYKKYGHLNTRFLYVFVNDTREDAQGFSHEYQLKSDAVLANTKLKTDFHNPQLPTVYVGDRRGWLLNRYVKMDEKDLAHFEHLLQLTTSF